MFMLRLPIVRIRLRVRQVVPKVMVRVGIRQNVIVWVGLGSCCK